LVERYEKRFKAAENTPGIVEQEPEAKEADENLRRKRVAPCQLNFVLCITLIFA
jgi:hypothetical protein